MECCSGLKGLPSLSVSPEWPAALSGLYRRAASVVVCAPRYAPLKAAGATRGERACVDDAVKEAAMLGVNGLPWRKVRGQAFLRL